MSEAISPGINLPNNLKWRAFSKSSGQDSKIQLHSDSHPVLDYTANQENASREEHIKHYVAIYDETCGELEIIEARLMTARRIIRQASPASESGSPVEPVSNYVARSNLTQEFGTKKSKKLIQQRADNVVFDTNGDSSAAKSLSEALLSSMPEPPAPSQDADGRRINPALAAIQAARPIPEPNMIATDISEAYPLSSLVFPHPYIATLKSMPIAGWCDTVSQGKPVLTTSRFVAHRVEHVCRSIKGDETHIDASNPTKLHLLRYLLLLIDIHRKLSHRSTKFPLSQMSQWSADDIADIASLSSPLLGKIIKRYCPAESPRPSKYHLTLLQTTILTLALHIPLPSGIYRDTSNKNNNQKVLITPISDIQADLLLPSKEIRRLFRELGCSFDSPRTSDRGRGTIQQPDSEVPKEIFAKLQLPLVFPDLGSGMRGGGGAKRKKTR